MPLSGTPLRHTLGGCTQGIPGTVPCLMSVIGQDTNIGGVSGSPNYPKGHRYLFRFNPNYVTKIKLTSGNHGSPNLKILSVKFSGNCQANFFIRNIMLQDQFNRHKPSYGGDCREHTEIDINNLAIIVDSLKPGKSPGFDGITIYHFKYADSCVLLFRKY